MGSYRPTYYVYVDFDNHPIGKPDVVHGQEEVEALQDNAPKGTFNVVTSKTPEGLIDFVPVLTMEDFFVEG